MPISRHLFPSLCLFVLCQYRQFCSFMATWTMKWSGCKRLFQVLQLNYRFSFFYMHLGVLIASRVSILASAETAKQWEQWAHRSLGCSSQPEITQLLGSTVSLHCKSLHLAWVHYLLSLKSHLTAQGNCYVNITDISNTKISYTVVHGNFAIDSSRYLSLKHCYWGMLEGIRKLRILKPLYILLAGIKLNCNLERPILWTAHHLAWLPGTWST